MQQRDLSKLLIQQVIILLNFPLLPDPQPGPWGEVYVPCGPSEASRVRSWLAPPLSVSVPLSRWPSSGMLWATSDQET